MLVVVWVGIMSSHSSSLADLPGTGGFGEYGAQCNTTEAHVI